MSFIEKSWENTDTSIKKLLTSRLEAGKDDSFYVFNADDLEQKVKFWYEKFPRVKPFFAMKAAHSDIAIRTMAKLGTGFDCASKSEMKRILDLNVHPDRIIYANPAKQLSHLKFAQEYGVDKMTFDSTDELQKIKAIYPKAKVVLRIRFDAQKALLSFGNKFGCDPDSEAPQLIKECKALKLNLIGISFHAGFRVEDPRVYGGALRAMKKLFDFAASVNLKMNFVDIGGGFSGMNMGLVGECAEIINNTIEECFPDPSIEVISEPGLYFAQTSMKLLCCVHSRRVKRDESGKILHINYYLNNGVFTSFFSSLVVKVPFAPRLFLKSRMDDVQLYESTFWGQTCTSLDEIFKIEFQELGVGDWIIFDNFGAYGFCCASEFNGFNGAEIIPLIENIS